MSDSPNANSKWSKYTIEGDELVRAETCPNCGPGVFLGQHSDRKTCGKCGYTVKNE
ncbi:MAG: 30S ribosomal protein S27ae [Euryarchaeota archaeon]|jgi:small subunit ribosomal protein S27Ae|nr:30S ribosomal protein S27ae [Euryarchaeota archaeon]